MTGFTPYFANKLLGHGLGIASYTMPSGVYLKLHVGDPGPDGTANPSTTTTRALITWGSVANGAVQIAADLSFVLASREKLTHGSCWDASSAGNCLFTGELDEDKNLYLGDTFLVPSLSVQIPAGALL